MGHECVDVFPTENVRAFFQPVMLVFRGRDPLRITGNILNPKVMEFWMEDG